ncbi:hypothetical protein B0T17DRAFT_618276 [Bombardia bombarda]|uniref:NAD(P)-binding protein n=1 Tax=Bombardia bombarda TaxID=252184 RepID=A0AA40C1T8_9PEZI|nr:hypothetical protein B0T17DRAFT_618276 [Bombardia bombarda]
MEKVLISGANRGLGKGLLAIYLARPNHVVIAANRNPDHPTSKALFDLPTGEGSKLIVVKVDSGVETDPFDAVNELEKQGVEHLDLVVANAGVAAAFPPVLEVKRSDLKLHMEANVYGTVSLYQATAGLLRKGTNPRWVTVGSSAGFIVLPVPNAAYGPAKVAAHWLTKRIDAEEEKIAAFVMHPGWVQTEMGNASAVMIGYGQAPETIDDSVNGQVKVFDAATKETHGGKMWDFHGELQVW